MAEVGEFSLAFSWASLVGSCECSFEGDELNERLALELMGVKAVASGDASLDEGDAGRLALPLGSLMAGNASIGAAVATEAGALLKAVMLVSFSLLLALPECNEVWLLLRAIASAGSPILTFELACDLLVLTGGLASESAEARGSRLDGVSKNLAVP